MFPHELDLSPDVIQLGTSPHERYISHKDKFGMPGWLNQIKDQNDWRQMDHVFAKRCEKKNPTYIPKDFTKEDEIYTKGKAKEIEDGQRCKDRTLKRQIDKKRQVMTCEEEEKMLEQAFEKGVIRIPVSELLDWNVAKKIADELGFDSSAFKEKRNKGLFDLLQDLKQELATSGVYQQRKTNLPLDKEVIAVNKDAVEDIKDSAKVRDLKRINRRLQNENAKLAAEVAKLSEFKDVLIEMGLWK
jgi:hypothetical protein